MLCNAVTRTGKALNLVDKETPRGLILILSMYRLAVPISYVIDVIYVNFSFYGY